MIQNFTWVCHSSSVISGFVYNVAMKTVVEWILYIGFALLVFYVVRNGIPFIDLQDLPDAILNSVSTHE